MERRLAAILATDVVGYSRLMGVDEAGTLAALRAHRAELIDPKAAQYNGRTIKLMGDGALMEFPSVVDAVTFAVEVQLVMRQRNAGLPEDRQIHYRVGINIGDIIVEDDDIFGDGVNLAARLEGLADPGGVCVRRNVRNQVRDKLDLSFEELGEIEVKNIDRPVRAFRIALDNKAAALATPVVAAPVAPVRRPGWQLVADLSVFMALLGGLAWWQIWAPSAAPTALAPTAQSPAKGSSIAVLAFKNLSGDPNQDYFSDAIAEDITTELSRFRELFVISRESAFSYKGQSKTAKQIGQELGVRYLLEGSVQRAGNRLRVTVQLIDTNRQNHVWAEKYDRDVVDVLVVQDDIVRSVVTTLGEEIWQNAAADLKNKPLTSFEAYDYRLRGSEALHRLTKDSNQEARRLYLKALELDPGQGIAYVGLAWTHLLDYIAQWVDVGPEALDQAFDYTQQARENGAPGYHVHRLFGRISAARNEHDKALEHNARAIELNPNDGDLLATQAMLLRDEGRFDEARQWINDAIRRNPHHPDWYGSVLAAIHYLEKDYEQAVAVLNRVESLAIWDHLILAASYAQSGLDEKARQHAEEVLAINPDFSLSRFKPKIQYRKQADREHYLDGLIKAGLPE
jgi:adenylate cyclase